MTLFFDASALVKAYVRELASDQVTRWLLAGKGVIGRLSEVEVVSALHRRNRAAEIAPAALAQAIADFNRDLLHLRVVETTPAVVRLARELLARHPLRASDAIQLASALILNSRSISSVRFVCFDARLLAAARAEALVVE